MATAIGSLPNELLCSCFSHLSEDKTAIRNLRLASKRFYEAASPFLVTKIRVRFTAQSFKDLEKLAAHRVFSKGVHRVYLDVSYYDKVLVNSIRRFAEHHQTLIDQEVDLKSRFMDPPSELWVVAQEFGKVNSGSFNVSEATDYQKILMRAHAVYKTLYTDQQNIMDDSTWGTRLSSAFENFPKLRELIVADVYRGPSGMRVQSWSDAVKDEDGLYHCCLFTTSWKGSFRTAIDTEPPTHLIHQLFTSLANSSVRLRCFDLQLTAPFDLRSIRFTDIQLDEIRKAVSKTKHMYMKISNWDRRGSLAENNDRPRDEMAGLCRFTSAFYSSQHLTDIQLSLDNYPAFYEPPTVSLADFLPLPLPGTSTLTKLYLRNPPVTIEELEALKNCFQSRDVGRLKRLVLYSPWLLSGDWIHALDVLRDMCPTDHVELQYPKGGLFSAMWTRNAPRSSAYEAYMTGESDQNPLIGFTPENS